MEPKFSADGQSVAFAGLDYRLAETIPTGITEPYVARIRPRRGPSRRASRTSWTSAS
jgi:hypothetical protein